MEKMNLKFLSNWIGLDPCLKWGIFKKGLELHIVPADMGGFTDHELSSQCSCNPRFVEKDSITGKELYVHNEAS